MNKKISNLEELVAYGCGMPKVSKSMRSGWAGVGWYLHHEEYPDEGSLFVGHPKDVAERLEEALKKLHVYDEQITGLCVDKTQLIARLKKMVSAFSHPGGQWGEEREIALSEAESLLKMMGEAP